MEWMRKNGGDLFGAMMVTVFGLGCLMGLIALAKATYCYLLQACGG
jgi:hypothetical protein